MAGRLSKVAITSEFPDYYKSLSRRLYKVLDDVGASASVRDVVSKTMKTSEILQSLRTPFSVYIFGSSIEGTTTPGLKSDVDSVIVHTGFPVVINKAEAQHYPYCCLLVQDSNTPAGYTKLQCVVQGVPVTRTITRTIIPHMGPNIIRTVDPEDRIVLTLPSAIFELGGAVRHGPAATFEATQVSVASDIVGSVRSSTWPECASEWLVRERNYNLPTTEQINKCKNLGCYFVYVGHPKSDENHLQWRLSFSLQERLLVTNFNSVQLKCYILLKMIKNERIHKRLGEKSLSSYQFKTCMLYMIENTPAEFWTEENLLVCLHHCLQQLLVWAETGVCPNYFIPEENMFDGRVFGQLRIRTCEILRQILSADFKFLLNIRTDMLGIRCQEALESGIVTSRYGQTAAIHLLKPGFAVYQFALNLRNSFFANCQNTASPVCAQELCEVKDMLMGTSRVTEHSVSETREALSLLLPYVDIALMSVQIEEAKHRSASNGLIFNLLTCERWHAIDSVTAKLKQASAMCMLAYCELSFEILLGLQERIEQRISVCGCHDVLIPVETFLEKSPPVIVGCSYEELLHRHFIPCVVYLPAERDLTPPALCYEMDRSVGSTMDDKKHWYDWAVVDGKVLFYLLLYLNHDHLGMEANAVANVLSLLRLAVVDDKLRHRETACNILGWIYKEKGLIDQARTFFTLSLIRRPRHNAASFHLRDINSRPR